MLIKKILPFIIVLIILTGCRVSQSDNKEISVSINIIAEETLLSETILLSEGISAEKAIVTACNEKEVKYTLKNGMFTAFDSFTSTKTDGWLLYIDGTLAEVGANQYKIQDADVLEFKYQNYDEAFSVE